MIKVCQWEQRDGFKICTVCNRRYYGPAENPVANCGGHKVHGRTMRTTIDVPLRQKPAPDAAPKPCKPCAKQKEIKARIEAAKKERRRAK